MKQLLTLILPLFCTPFIFSQTNELKKIDELFKHWNSSNTPGCALGVIKNNEVVLSKCYGMANLDFNIPVNDNTKFSIASLTKQFTAYSIAILIHQGKLRLEDDIRRYLPDFPYTKDTLRIKHLIYHTNGLDDLSTQMRICGDSFDDLNSGQMIKEKVYAQADLKFKPGEKFEYSNSGYYLLAEIIEKVSKLTIDEFAREYIFRPLGMNDTYFYTNPGVITPDMSVSYTQNVFGKYQKQYINTPPIGSGNLISTLHDLLLWEQNFYDDKLFNNKLNNLILRQGILNNGDSINYCFGLKIGNQKQYGKIIYHFGDFNSFESVIVIYPDQKLTIIILSNDQHAKTYFDNYSMADKVAEVFLDKDASPKIPDDRFVPFSTKESIEKYIGAYKSKNGITNISFDDGNLKISHSWGDWYYSIFPKSDTVFFDIYDFEYPYKFKFDDHKNVVGLWTSHTGYMEKVYIDSIYPLSDDYSGSFHSKDLNSVYKLFQVQGKVYCKINSRASEELIITGKDMFRLKDNEIKIFRNDLNTIERLEVNARFNFYKINDKL